MVQDSPRERSEDTLEVHFSLWWMYLLAAMFGIGSLVVLIVGLLGPRPVYVTALITAGMATAAVVFFLGARYGLKSAGPVMRLTNSVLEFPGKDSFVIAWDQISFAEVAKIKVSNGTAEYLGIRLTDSAQQAVKVPSGLKAISLLPKLVTQSSFDILLNADSFTLTASQLAEEINSRSRSTSADG